MRKVFWTAATAALLAGVYWSVAHATVHPRSPVGQALAWFGLGQTPATPVAVAPVCVRTPGCTDDTTPTTIQVEAHKPAGLIVLEPTFRPMPDPDGADIELPVIVRTPAVREVVVPGEEFRIMPEPEPLRPEPILEDPIEVPAEPRNTLSIGIGVGASSPIEISFAVKMGDCCQEMTLTGLYALLTGKAAPPVAERLTEPPVEGGKR